MGHRYPRQLSPTYMIPRKHPRRAVEDLAPVARVDIEEEQTPCPLSPDPFDNDIEAVKEIGSLYDCLNGDVLHVGDAARYIQHLKSTNEFSQASYDVSDIDF
ncbi:hypothetical protein Y032_0538g3130 [Ancylostoma ceylanicum]|nr:hypothetical protein Y032_0538g3130 [Ancylostoma ceylanicum]